MSNGPGDDPRQLQRDWELVQQQLQAVDHRLSMLEQSLMDVQQGISTLAGLAQSEGSVEALVPVGGGVQVRARIEAAGAVLVPLGAGYATEGTLEEAQKRLQERMEATAKAFQQASQQAEQLGQTARAIAARLEQGDEGALAQPS